MSTENLDTYEKHNVPLQEIADEVQKLLDGYTTDWVEQLNLLMFVTVAAFRSSSIPDERIHEGLDVALDNVKENMTTNDTARILLCADPSIHGNLLDVAKSFVAHALINNLVAIDGDASIEDVVLSTLLQQLYPVLPAKVRGMMKNETREDYKEYTLDITFLPSEHFKKLIAHIDLYKSFYDHNKEAKLN